jgi:hypothetical protein
MKLLCELSVTMRLAGLAFVVGLVIGLMLGGRAADGRTEPARVPSAAGPAISGESPSWPPLSWF